MQLSHYSYLEVWNFLLILTRELQTTQRELIIYGINYIPTAQCRHTPQFVCLSKLSGMTRQSIAWCVMSQLFSAREFLVGYDFYWKLNLWLTTLYKDVELEFNHYLTDVVFAKLCSQQNFVSAFVMQMSLVSYLRARHLPKDVEIVAEMELPLFKTR
jgi:hypothetical protein